MAQKSVINREAVYGEGGGPFVATTRLNTFELSEGHPMPVAFYQATLFEST